MIRDDTKKVCKIWEHVPNRVVGGGGLAHSQIKTWEHFVRGGGVWKNVPNPK